jgi:menaquinone-dependent protoporphyrinogen oxidase
MKVLIVYGTTEGQTRKIAEFLKTNIEKGGHVVALCDATQNPVSPAEYDAVLVGASMHMEKYQTSIADYVHKHNKQLNKMHSAFFSVSLTAAGDDEASWKELKRITDHFLAYTGWKPSLVEYVAGALRFTEYDFFKKYIMRMIAKNAGHPHEGSEDTEYTDWNKLAAFVTAFIDKWVPQAQTVCEPESDQLAAG